MIVSPAERHSQPGLYLAVLGAALIAVAFTAPAAAQDQTSAPQPLSLIPSATLSPMDPDVPGHSVIRARTAPAATPEAPRETTGAIEVNPLEEIAPDSIGILGPEAGGFGVEMWWGSQRQVVARLLRRLPETMNSRELHSLARRLLTSIAAPPTGQFEGADEEGPSLLTLRLERLLALGEIQHVNDLLALVPSHRETESAARLRVDAALLAGDYAEACRRIRKSIALHHQIVYWQKAMVFCHMAVAEVDQMMLALDLLRERGV